MNARRRLLAILLAAIVVGPAVSSWAQRPQKKVLVIHSRQRDTEFSIVADQRMPRLLDQGVGRKVDYYSEHIDANRFFTDEKYKRAFSDYLARKYRGAHFDLVIATHQLAFNLVSSYRKKLFPNTPVVYLTEDRAARRIPNSTGIVAERDYSGTIRLALELQPDTTQVFVVSGRSSRDEVNGLDAQDQFASLSPRLRFTYLRSLTAQETERRVAALPPHSIVFYLLFYQDGAGVNFSPAEYVDRLTRVANRPVYSWVDSMMGRGIVGGSLLRTDAEVDAVTSLALRVLRGERPASIPVKAQTLNGYQVDWRQLQRWGIREARVPAGTRILFRVPGFLERYGGYIAGAALLFIAQATFIAILFFQRTQLRRAEELARGGEARLRASYDRIRDLGGRLIAAQDAERSRIARDLHDDISQQIALVALELQMLTDLAPQHELDAETLGRGLLNRVRTLGRSVHEMSHQLHPAKLRLIGLVSSIDGLRRDFSRPGMTIVFSHDGVPPELSHDLTVALFRVAQEAVRNATEHSRARNVSVRLTGTMKGLALTIDDDGTGFDVNAVGDKGLGLISMRERVDSIGGTLTIHSSRGRGTRLEIEVPNAMELAPGAGDSAAGLSRNGSRSPSLVRTTRSLVRTTLSHR